MAKLFITPTVTILASILIAIVGILAAVIFGFNPYASPLAVPVVDPNVSESGFESPATATPPAVELPSSAACAPLEGSELQACCQSWAEDNKIPMIRCLGTWIIQNNACAYACGQ